MKILGFEINRAKTAAEPTRASETITVQKSNGTQPSIPLKRAQPKAELGDSGTRMSSGLITEEYNPQLRGKQGIKVYDQMRRSDGTVQAALRACTLPVRRARWFVKTASEEQVDQDIASFTENALFNWMDDMTWDDIIRQALLMLPFGVMPFEKVYVAKNVEGKEYVTLKKLAPRMPTSIVQWELSNKTFGIRQQRTDGGIVEIPGSKLVIFINEREGDNWDGTSILRAAYKHWYYKDKFYNIDAMSAERQGLGVPVMHMPPGYTENDEAKATQVMENLRANASAYMILPDGYEAEFMNMGASTTKDLTKSIDTHDKAILLSMLAQFLGLGQTSSGSGSYALTADHSDLFLKSVETVASTIKSEIDKLIKELVSLNFSGVTKFPTIEYAGITKMDVAGLASAYGALITAGGIKPIESDESFLRGMLGLPALSQEDIDKREEDEAKAETMNPNPADPNAKPTEDPEDMTPADKNKPTKEDEEAVDDAMEDETPTDKQKASEHACGGKCDHSKQKKSFEDGSGYQSWRPLTFAEQKVTFDKIEQTMNDLEEKFEKSAREILGTIKDKYMSKINKALQDGDARAVKELEVKFATEYKSLLKQTMKSAYEYGKNNAAKEMGVDIPANSADDIATIDLMADSITQKTMMDLDVKGKLATAHELKSANNTVQSAALIDQLLDDAVDSAVINTRGLIVNDSLNTGRNRIFENNRALIYALQRSEILDQSTCNFCLSMDGRVIKPDDSWSRSGSFHSNCRGIWVEILKDEQNPPEIGEIPANLGDYYGGQPNELIQPPRVIAAPGTLAEEFVKSKKK